MAVGYLNKPCFDALLTEIEVMMELLLSPSSPYARTVRLLLSALNADRRVIQCEVNVFEADSTVFEANPLGKIPCLKLEDGQALVDSQLICEYIDVTLGSNYWHQALVNNWPLKNLYMLSKGLSDVAVAWRVEKAKATGDGFWMTRFADAIERTLTQLENQLAVLKEDSMATLALQSALSYLNFRHGELEWEARFGGLSEFFDVQESKAYAQVNGLREMS